MMSRLLSAIFVAVIGFHRCVDSQIPISCEEEMANLATPMQTVCCAPPAICAADGAPPTECSPDCAVLFVMFYNRCSEFLRDNRPEFLAFGRECQEQQEGLR
jgi:hypothetical protein